MERFSWHRRVLLVGASVALAISTAGLLGAHVSLSPTRAYAGPLGADPIPCPAVVISATTGGNGTVVTSGSGQGIIVSGPGTVAASSSSNGTGTTIVTSSSNGSNQGVAIAGSGSTVFSSGSGGATAFSGTMPGVSINIPGVSVTAGGGGASVSVPGMSLAVPNNTAGVQPLCQVFNVEPTGQCGNVQVYVPDNGLFYCVLGQ
jgi:hypothetical protein